MSEWTPPEPIPVLLLAAGASTRFGDDKLLAPLGGQPLLTWVFEALQDVVPIDHVLVVTGPTNAARRDLCELAGFATIVADDAARGMRWSLHAGLAACPPTVPGAVVVLGDDPLTIRALPGVLATARADLDRIVAVRRTPVVPHPVYLPRRSWPAPPKTDDDTGLRDLLGDESVCWIDGDDVAPIDVDEPADLARLARLLAPRT